MWNYWKRLVNLPFTKHLHNSEHHTQHHFPRMNCSRQYWQTQFSSTAEFSNEMKLRLPPFSLTCIRVSTHVFGFIIFYLWVNSGNVVLWQTRHTGSFQILCLGSCPLSANQKILLISLAKYTISGQPDKEADLLDLYGFMWIRFQINHFSFSEKYADFIHSVLLTIRRMDQILGKGSITIAL